MYLYKSFFLLINVQIFGLGPTKIQYHLLLIRLDLQRSNFQIRSISEVATVVILIAPAPNMQGETTWERRVCLFSCLL